MIVPYDKTLTNSFFDHKFANKLLSDQRTLRIGNIVSFLSEVHLKIDEKEYHSDQSMNFCIEIPEISNYAGVCFQKLFLTNVANILGAKYYKESIEILNNDIIIKKEHVNGGINQVDGIVSLNLLKNVNGAILIYLGLYNQAGYQSQPRSFSLQFAQDVCNKMMDDINSNFYYLANSIFLQTAKM